MRLPKNKFGREITAFAAREGLTLKQIAQACGISYNTLLPATTSTRPGTKAVCAVRKYMAEYHAAPREKAS